jgi:MFS family permease
MGRLADLWNRRILAVASVAGWSVMTGLCGLAGGFGPLFLARMGVGVGEAGLSPAAVSLISDYFPKDKRAKPLSFLSVGTTAGAGLALIFGGAIVSAVGGASVVRAPTLGEVYAWQAIFLGLGLFGLVFAAIYATIEEPQRRETAQEAESVRAVASHLWRNRGFFASQILGASFTVLVLIAFHSWTPTYLIRHFGWRPGEAGLVYGLAVALGGVAGILTAGFATDHFIRRGRSNAHLLVSAAAAAIGAPFMVLAMFAPDPALTMIGLFLGIMALTIPPALAPVALQNACPNQMRGQAFAVYLFVLSLLGYAVGPLAVALATDHVFSNEQMVGYSLALVAAIFAPAATLFLFLASKFHR